MGKCSHYYLYGHSFILFGIPIVFKDEFLWELDSADLYSLLIFPSHSCFILSFPVFGIFMSSLSHALIISIAGEIGVDQLGCEKFGYSGPSTKEAKLLP